MSSDVKQWIGTVEASSAQGDEFEATATTGGLDRESDSVGPEGAETANCKKNPVIQYGHAHAGADSVPVAIATELGRMGNGWRIRGRWNTDPKYELAQRVRRAWENGFLRTLSIGFLPLRWEPNASGGMTYTSWEWLETSIVPIPANAEATRGLKALGLWRGGDEKNTLPPYTPPEKPVSELDVVLATRAAIREALTERVQAAVHKQIRRARGDVDLFLTVSDLPAAGAARALRHHVGNDPTLKVAGMSDHEVRRQVAELTKTALADAIASAVTTAIRHARGRID
jgi:hypothetical protein